MVEDKQTGTFDAARTETDAADNQSVAVEEISPLAWRLLRTAAGYDQRDVESELDVVMQAHISMLESDTRSLSADRLEQLYELYTAELFAHQVQAIVDNF